MYNNTHYDTNTHIAAPEMQSINSVYMHNLHTDPPVKSHPLFGSDNKQKQRTAAPGCCASVCRAAVLGGRPGEGAGVGVQCSVVGLLSLSSRFSSLSFSLSPSSPSASRHQLQRLVKQAKPQHSLPPW